MEERVAEAVELFKGGLNCAQALLAVYGEEFGVSRELAERLALGLEGGLGRQGELCGAVTGACLVLGLKAGGLREVSASRARKLALASVAEFTGRFKARFGSLNCRDLLGADLSTFGGLAEAKTRGSFRRRCPVYVETAARILEEMLAETSHETLGI